MGGRDEGDGEDGRGGQNGAEHGLPDAHDGGSANGDDDQDEGCGADDRGLERNEFLGEIHEWMGAGEGAEEEQEHPAVELPSVMLPS